MVNVVKESVEPASLAIERVKKNGNYRGADVVTQIRDDFNNKCYLCEDKDLTNINVEHFKPHRGNVSLEFQWSNLFYCCVHCNNTKGDKTEFDDILNCTLTSDDVLENIKLEVEAMPFGEVKVTCINTDQPTLNTALLLEQIYNGTTPLKLIEGENLRKKIIQEVNEFIKLLFKFVDETNTPEQKADYKDLLRRKLSEKSPFTAFKVWIVKGKPKLLAELKEFIPSIDKIYKDVV